MTVPARDLVADVLRAALARAVKDRGWQAADAPIDVEVPANHAHGDYATSVALRLAKPLRMPPREIAQAIADRVEKRGMIAAVEIAGAGFINVRLAEDWIRGQVDAIVADGASYGRSDRLAGRKVQVEYVSANPTGPMTVANARGGPLGDVLANVLALSGATVTREYYENDVGTQVEALAKSVALRYRELGGELVTIPEDAYPAEYVIDIARQIRDRAGGTYDRMPVDEQAKAFLPITLDIVIEWHKRAAKKFGIAFDVWYRESELMRSGYFEKTVAELRRLRVLEDRDGAVWLRSRELGEDIDSVVIRSNGEPTYFGKDIAYHREALVERGFDRKIDIWGANTHGHMRRMKTALGALGLAERWKVVLYQYVRFLHEGVLTKMGKRTGQFLLLEDVIDAVGTDAARFFFLQSSAESSLDFDFELAVQQSNENPVYYVQYAHARIASIFRTAAERGISAEGADVSRLSAPAERELIRLCMRLPELLADIVEHSGVHLLTVYALELAGAFHAYYRDHRVVTDDVELSKARLRLAQAVQVTLRQVLALLGVSAPESM